MPFIIADKDREFTLRKGGKLADIAPTVLNLMGLPKSHHMTGRSLINNGARRGAGAQDKTSRCVLLLILDGWGERDDGDGNLIAKASTPSMARLKRTCPHTLLAASGEAVGLSHGTVGNSEAGHLIYRCGKEDTFRQSENRSVHYRRVFLPERGLSGYEVLCEKNGNALHLMGIVSFFSSHGLIYYLLALLDLAKQEGVKNVFVHAMLGRRGDMLESGAKYIKILEEKCGELGFGRVASVIGGYWSMDREENWNRIEKAYRMLVYGEGTPVNERS